MWTILVYIPMEEVCSGVPQVSLLDPILFSVFINDLNGGIEGMLLKFVDDTYLWGTANRRQPQGSKGSR